MKPYIIGSLGSRPWPLPLDLLIPEPGEIESHRLDDDWIAAADDLPVQEVSRIARGAGFVETRHAECLVVNGSIRWHTDPVYGLGVCALIHNDNGEPWTNHVELITKHGPLPLKLGDIFVFNSDLGHAWISQEVCMLISQTVKRVRKPSLLSSAKR